MQSAGDAAQPAQKDAARAELQLKAGNTALVIVDVQDSSPGWKEWKDETKNIKTLIEKCRAKGLPIIILSLNFEGLREAPGRNGRGRKKYEVTGIYPKGYASIIPELKQALQGYGKAVFVEKATENAFDDPRQGFEKALQKNGIQNIIFTGFNQEICVKDAVESSIKKGYIAIASMETMWGNQGSADESWMTQRANAFYGKNTQLLSFDKLLDAIAKIK